MELGARIKQEREKLSMSQEELSQRMNISRQAVSKWETGKSYPDIETIIKLSELFHLTLDELVKGDKTFQEKLIKEGKSKMTGLSILGFILAALGVIVVIWGGAQYPVDLMSSNFMSFLVGGLFLLAIGLVLIRWMPHWAQLSALYLTGAAIIVYLIGFKMPTYVLLSGIVVTLGAAWWLTTLILKR
ncbi:Helix-turn-helix [Sporobacter termitidis DSM 10068]|uniref:Helix-turn-helix n=1 Tax=Sporobacter termitidis DSM 10068 TaxID=1123282 RepID=A0A1M5WIN0_9FIRM|nr:helix-turn-helix transcriptional regulator [Sporobacter termitidis]SHH87074.1 Helix-turn-helix [Sporobacter termitidis DSM 10068]